MIHIGHLYKHKHFKTLVQVTANQGNWVEFREGSDLRWLETLVFEQAYRCYNEGDPIPIDLELARETQRQKGILIPREFSK
jgi:hypothetical protein